MLSNQIKCQDVTSHPGFWFPQWLWRPSSNKPESCFVKRVNTHEGCWYHSWQDHDPSLMMSNQIKWQDVTSPPLILFPTTIMKALKQYTWISFDERFNSRERCWYHSRQDHDPSLTLSNQIKCQDVTLPLLCLFPTMLMKALKQ
jgi:hypothetical protein